MINFTFDFIDISAEFHSQLHATVQSYLQEHQFEYQSLVDYMANGLPSVFADRKPFVNGIFKETCDREAVYDYIELDNTGSQYYDFGACYECSN